MTPADRTDLIEEAQKRLSVLEEYAPKMMDADEIKAVIQTVLSELGIETPTAKRKENHEGTDAESQGKSGRQRSKPDPCIHDEIIRF